MSAYSVRAHMRRQPRTPTSRRYSIVRALLIIGLAAALAVLLGGQAIPPSVVAIRQPATAQTK